jgi:hypothetical protein
MAKLGWILVVGLLVIGAVGGLDLGEARRRRAAAEEEVERDRLMRERDEAWRAVRALPDWEHGQARLRGEPATAMARLVAQQAAIDRAIAVVAAIERVIDRRRVRGLASAGALERMRAQRALLGQLRDSLAAEARQLASGAIDAAGSRRISLARLTLADLLREPAAW